MEVRSGIFDLDNRAGNIHKFQVKRNQLDYTKDFLKGNLLYFQTFKMMTIKKMEFMVFPWG